MTPTASNFRWCEQCPGRTVEATHLAGIAGTRGAHPLCTTHTNAYIIEYPRAFWFRSIADLIAST